MIPYFDAHCDTIFRCDETGESLGRNSGQVDLLRAAAFSRYRQLFALYYDARLAPPEGMLPVCRRLHDRFCREMAENRDRIAVCRTGAEAEEAARQGKAGFTDQAILRARLGGRLRLPGLRLDGTKLIAQRTHGYLPSIWL